MEKNYRKGYIEKLTGGGVLYERDVLAIMLSNAFGGKDMSDIAGRLLDRFPSIKAILRAELDELRDVDGVSERVALYIYTVGRLEKYNPYMVVSEIKDVKSFGEAMATLFVGCDNENAHFYIVNRRGKVIAEKRFTSAREDSVIIPTDEFLRFLSADKAYGLYCAHNHVTGPCFPSVADDKLTGRIQRLCMLRGVRLCDHVISNGSGETFSYALSGRLETLPPD